jgi:WD40 repeat protein
METSPDKSVIVAGLEYGPGLLVLDADSLDVLRRVRLPEQIGNVFDLSFSTDGRLLAAAGDLGGVAVLDTGSWRLRGTPANLHDYGVLQVEWLPDNRTLVSAGADGRVVLFDTQRGTTRARPLPASTEAGEGYSHLVPGINDELTVLSGERPGRRYTLDPARWLTRACEVVGRDFTRAEWARYLPGRPYGSTCSDLS